MKKKARSKNPLYPKPPFKWVLMDIIPKTAPKRLTSDTAFSNPFLIVDAHEKKFKNLTPEEVMDYLDMFRSRFENRRIWLVGIRNNFSRYRDEVYFYGVQRKNRN